MSKFNVTKIAPDGFLHHAGFDEVIASLAWSLSALGHSVNVTQNWLSEHGETNIIFGTELMADFQRLPQNSICFNLEQPSHPNMAKVRKLAAGVTVWDYSSRAVEEWKAAGHSAVVHVPIGFTPNLVRIPHGPTDIDVFHFGWSTPRRAALIDELRRAGLSVVDTSACYGGGRDNLISRAKTVLNIHHDGRDRFEIVRVSYLMANAKCVVTELSADDDEYADLAPGLSRSPYRMLLESCRAYAATGSERQLMEEKAMALISKRDFTQAVAAALDSVPAPTTPALSRPMEFATTRAVAKREFIADARKLDPRALVNARYVAARASGDMKDFVEWIRDHAKGNCLEIGVRDGASTSAFLSGIQNSYGHLYSVDIDPCGHLFAGHPQWTFIQADSKDLQTVIKQIPFQLDMILIDGDHSKVGVLNDLEYVRQLHSGGMVLFHDTEPTDRPEGCNDMSWPGDDVKNVYWSLVEHMGKQGWAHEELPGKYGMGVLYKPPSVGPTPVDVPETSEAK